MRNKMIIFVSTLLVVLTLSGCFLLKPVAPLLNVPSVTSSSITLNWTENSSVDGFKLYKKVGGSFTLIASIDKSQRTYTDNSVEQNTAYSYKMLSYKLNVNSDWSSVVTATTTYILSGYVKDPSNSPIPNVIVHFSGYSSATTDGNGFWHKDGLSGEVALTPQKAGWVFTPSSVTASSPSNSLNFTGVEIPVAPFNPYPSNSSTNVSISSSLSWQCSGSFLKYDVHFGTSINPPIVALGLGQNFYNPNHLNYATTYYWQVSAKNSVGSATGPLWSFTTESTPVPNAPTDLEVTSYSTNSISMSWTDNSSDEDEFEIARSKDGVYFPKTENLPPNTDHYTDLNLSSNTVYYYKVRAHNSGGYSGWSNVASVRTAFDNLQPNKPSNPTPFNGAASVSTTTNLSWQCSDPNGDALTYDVYFGTTANPLLLASNVTSTNYDPGSLSYSTKYYWKIVAKDGKGGVTSGDAWSFTTATQSGTGTISGKVDVYTGESGFITSSSKPVLTNTKWQIASHPKNEYVANEIIVGFKSGFKVSSLISTRTPFDYKVKSTLRTPNDEVNIALVKVSASVEEAIDYFKKLPNVKYAEPNYISYALSTPNDAYYNKQWGLSDVHIPQVWQSGIEGANTVIVAVIDTGVSPTHPDLQGVLVNGYNFVSDNTNTADDYGHGTHVAGIIAADTNNSIGVAGVNWGGTFSTKIMPIKVLNSNGRGNGYWIAEGIVYAVKHGAKVINMSLGGTGLSYTEQDACQYAYDNGVTLVAAAGNDGVNTLDYPAAFPTVIPVAAVGPDNTLAYYSNYTSDVVCAPGGAMHYQDDPSGIVSTYYATSTQSNTYAYLQGTSMAAPHVSGIVALMISNGITDPANIWNVIKNTATNIGSSSQYGYGLINAYSAVTYNGGWKPMIVLAEDQNSNVVDSTWIDSDGDYSLTLPAGTYKIYAWQDFNGDDVVNTGDFYGYAGYNGSSSNQPQNISVGANSSINVHILVSPEVNDTNNPLGIAQVSRLKNITLKAIQDHYKLSFSK